MLFDGLVLCAANDRIIPPTLVTPMMQSQIAPSDLALLSHSAAEDMVAEFRQVVPYLVLYRRGMTGLAVFRRLKQSSGQMKCVNKISIGFGEHIFLRDLLVQDNVIDIGNTVVSAALKHLESATGLSLERGDIFQIVSSGQMIISDEGVDAEHIGLLYFAELSEQGEARLMRAIGDSDQLNPNDKLRHFLGFFDNASINELIGKEDVESWSGIVIRYLTAKSSEG